jgi:starch phosphorylase
MLNAVRDRVQSQLVRNRGSESHLDRLFRYADPRNPKVLTIGFGRRFATYKRSTLLFNDLDALRQIVSDPERPVLFVFAGKAHPADTPGQDLIRHIMAIAKMPEFTGHILLVENYDLRLARGLVAGVDVWLNYPVHPLEASGTSGMKAAMNGAINLSVLDGWWGEAYDGTNGWAIKPAPERLDQDARNRDEARTLYEVLQDRVVPMYYDRAGLAHSAQWVALAKRAMATVLPQFNAERMLDDYIVKVYGHAAKLGARYHADDCAAAREVAAWKERVRGAWDGVALRRVDTPAQRIAFGQSVHIEVGVRLNGLAAQDVAVELLVEDGRDGDDDNPRREGRELVAQGEIDGEERYALDLAPELCGKLGYRIRAYPRHPLLTHRFELGLMRWL